MYLTSDAFVFLLLLGSAKAHLLRGGRQSGALNSTHQLGGTRRLSPSFLQ
jgi:hypothetical protein